MNLAYLPCRICLELVGLKPNEIIVYTNDGGNSGECQYRCPTCDIYTCLDLDRRKIDLLQTIGCVMMPNTHPPVDPNGELTDLDVNALLEAYRILRSELDLLDLLQKIFDGA